MCLRARARAHRKSCRRRRARLRPPASEAAFGSTVRAPAHVSRWGVRRARAPADNFGSGGALPVARNGRVSCLGKKSSASAPRCPRSRGHGGCRSPRRGRGARIRAPANVCRCLLGDAQCRQQWLLSGEPATTEGRRVKAGFKSCDGLARYTVTSKNYTCSARILVVRPARGLPGCLPLLCCVMSHEKDIGGNPAPQQEYG